MPHQCTNCGRVFPDGSKEMLSGCPNCGGNKFQFSPSGSGGDAASTDRREASSSEPTPSSGGSADRDSTDREPADSGSVDRGSADDAGSTTWRRAASRAADADDAPDARGRDADRGTNGSNDIDSARRRGESLREWANSRGFASEVEDENDETTLRENRRQTGDARRRPPERRSGESPPDSATPASDSPDPSTESSAEADAPSPESSAEADAPSTPPQSSTETPSQSPTESPSTSSETPSPSQSDSPDSSRPNAPDATDAPDAPNATDAPDDPDVFGDDVEDDAQASARSDVVSPDEIRAAAEKNPPSDADGRVIEPQSDDRPGLDELREELNDQFESIKIVAPGEYELNLMELYDRPEYIISLREDGRYVIEVPDTWDGPDDR